MDTKFKKGDLVRSTVDAQKMKKGKVYRVGGFAPEPFGVVGYQLQDVETGQELPNPVFNGHLILDPVEPGDGNLAPSMKDVFKAESQVNEAPGGQQYVILLDLGRVPVSIGPFKSESEARKAIEQLEAAGVDRTYFQTGEPSVCMTVQDFLNTKNLYP